MTSKTIEIQQGFRASLFGLGTAVCFSSSSIFIRNGLKTLDSPLIGVTIGMIFCALAYGVVILVQRSKGIKETAVLPREVWVLQVFAGVLVGVATWWRWIALDGAPIAIVLALGRMSIPVVLVLSPFIIGRKAENVNLRVWIGAGLILAGASILTFFS